MDGFTGKLETNESTNRDFNTHQLVGLSYILTLDQQIFKLQAHTGIGYHPRTAEQSKARLEEKSWLFSPWGTRNSTVSLPFFLYWNEPRPHPPTAPPSSPREGPPVTQGQALIPSALSLSVPTNGFEPLRPCSPRPAGFRAFSHPDCILAPEKTQERR